MSYKKYWKASLTPKLKVEILRLFEEIPSIANQYDSNPVEFVREGVRLHIQKIRSSYVMTDEVRRLLVDEIIDRLTKD